MSRQRALSVSSDRMRAVAGYYFGYGFYGFRYAG
ncbi:hypothetical protein QOZ96_000916 [Brevundimonas nasdae]|jgi:hypothetical protein|nr:hypothetical protein [Brevundimonas nasdae]